MKKRWNANMIGAGLMAGSLLFSGAVWASDDEAEKVEQEASAATEETTELRSGEQVYKSACMACHVAEGRPTVAPPIFAVKNHVINVYPEREDFIKQITEWVKEPAVEKGTMPGAIRKFGLMPALELPDEELQAVAEYLYDADMSLPDWYKEHYEAEHGQQPEEASKAE